MVHQQKINRKPKSANPVVVDERPVQLPTPQIDPEKANAPVRTVHYVEVGDMDPRQIQLILQRLNQSHDTAKGGIQYFLPVRHGKIGSDVVFETEFESIVQQLCDTIDENGAIIENARIVLKGGAKEINIVRQQV